MCYRTTVPVVHAAITGMLNVDMCISISRACACSSDRSLDTTGMFKLCMLSNGFLGTNLSSQATRATLMRRLTYQVNPRPEHTSIDDVTSPSQRVAATNTSMP